MDTETIFPIEFVNNSKALKLIDTYFKDRPNLSDKDETLIKFYCYLEERIITIDLLYQIYLLNLNNLLNNFILKFDDEIIRINNNTEQNSYVLINGLFSNLVSSGKTLTDSIQDLPKNIKSYATKTGIDHNLNSQYISDIYDSNFSYKFCYHLRNYSQHGYLPISGGHNNKYYFNLSRILSSKHFDLKAEVEEELAKMEKKMIKEYNNEPNIALTYTISKYNLEMHRIYCKYMTQIKNLRKKVVRRINNIIKENSKIVFSDVTLDKKYILYIEENIMHFADLSGLHPKVFNDIRERAFINFKKEKKEMKRIKIY